MFRSKDKYLKDINLIKKKNNNKKDTKGEIKILKNSRGTIYGNCKAMQQYINNEYGIKIHKNTLRSGILSTKNINPNFYDTNNDVDDKFVGNIGLCKLHYIVNSVNKKNISQNWNTQHDKTKWNSAKKISKLNRNNDLHKYYENTNE
jgi:hypothetical protein